MHTVNIRVTHHTADVETLEAFAFPDMKKALKDIHALPSVKEVVIIQTCNRVEIFAAAEDVKLAYHDMVDYLMRDVIQRMKYKRKQEFKDMTCVPPDLLTKHIINFSEKLHDAMQVEYHTSALRHLLRLTSGIESMIIGEDQILGQVRESYQFAKALGTVGEFFDRIFTKALHVGQLVRQRTNINKGAVSIGSAAVELAEEVLSGLDGKTAMLIGAGEMGTLVAKSLAEHPLKKLIVTNRTYSKAEKIARELGGEALKIEEMSRGIEESDLVITATSSPQPIITKEKLRFLGNRERPLVIIDVAIPRDVSQDVEELPFVRAYNIDSLRQIAEKNKKLREKEIVKVEKIIEEELRHLVKRIYRIDVEHIVRKIFVDAEKIRARELAKAIKMLGDLDEREKKILEDLTRVIVKRTLSPIAQSIRKSAEAGDQQAVKIAEDWFGNGLEGE